MSFEDAHLLVAQAVTFGHRMWGVGWWRVSWSVGSLVCVLKTDFFEEKATGGCKLMTSSVFERKPLFREGDYEPPSMKPQPDLPKDIA